MSPEGEPGSLRLLGTLRWLEDKTSKAQRHWHRALERSKRIGSPFEQAEILRELARRTNDSQYQARALELHNSIGVQLESSYLGSIINDVERSHNSPKPREFTDRQSSAADA